MEKVILGFLFISSLFIIFIIFKVAILSLFKSSHNKDNLFLSLWFFIFLFCNVLIQFIAARFVLLLFPPMFLLLYKELILNRISFKRGLTKLISVSILITILISTILAIGDYYFAGLYRDFVILLKKKMPLDKCIYFCRSAYHPYVSWGYGYYLHKYYPYNDIRKIEENFGTIKNLFYVLPNQPVLPMVINRSCFLAYEELNYNSNYNKELINSFCYRSNVVLHNQRFHVGFYCHDWGLLPFYISFRKVPLETFEVYRLSAK
jgi:hypothetical protein